MKDPKSWSPKRPVTADDPAMKEQAALMHDALEAGILAFWEEVARRFPKVESGDLSMETIDRLNQTADGALIEWITWNAPRWKPREMAYIQDYFRRHGRLPRA